MYVVVPGNGGVYGGTGYGSFSLTFPKEFDTIPKVTFTYSGESKVYCNSVSNITRTGCTFNCSSTRGGNYGITIYWTATVD